MSFSLIFDVALVGLLIATLVYMIRLNRRLGALRSARTEFEGLIARFVECTTQAEQSMAELKLSATERGQALHENITRATTLRDDLLLLVERSSRLADQLEGAVTRSRSLARANTAPAQPPSQNEDAKPRTREEREILKALSSIR